MKPLAFLAALVLAGGAHAGPNLLVNGSFELGTAGIGSFSGWQTVLGDASTFVDSNGQTGTHSGQASDGLWSAFFGSTRDSGGSSISQAIATAPDRSFVLSFDLATDNAGGPVADGLSVSLNGIDIIDVSNILALDYVHESFTFLATSASTRLSFSAYNDSGYIQIDNVVVAALPEPETLPLIVAGLFAIVMGLRTRRGPTHRTTVKKAWLAGNE